MLSRMRHTLTCAFQTFGKNQYICDKVFMVDFLVIAGNRLIHGVILARLAIRHISFESAELKFVHGKVKIHI